MSSNQIDSERLARGEGSGGSTMNDATKDLDRELRDAALGTADKLLEEYGMSLAVAITQMQLWILESALKSQFIQLCRDARADMERREKAEEADDE